MHHSSHCCLLEKKNNSLIENDFSSFSRTRILKASTKLFENRDCTTYVALPFPDTFWDQINFNG